MQICSDYIRIAISVKGNFGDSSDTACCSITAIKRQMAEIELIERVLRSTGAQEKKRDCYATHSMPVIMPPVGGNDYSDERQDSQ